MAQYRPPQVPPSADPRRRVSTHYRQQQSPAYGPQSVVYSPDRGPFYPSQPRRYPPSRPSGGRHRQMLMAGGGMLALATLVVTPSFNRTDSTSNTGAADVCIKQVDKQSLVSRDELKAVIDLDPSAAKDQVRNIVDQPHCVLEPRAAENGIQVEREAYPLEFDPQTWLVLQYQDSKLAGFDFSFR
jgi:hypothetical protein